METPFIVLDQLNTAKGWSDKKGSGIWSNEVRKISDQLTVRTKEGILAIGKWSEIKANPICEGSSLTSWIELNDSVGGDSGLYGDKVFSCTEATDEKKGSVQFKKPKFSIVAKSLSQEAAEQADNMDKLLQAHLDAYLGQAKEDEEEPTVATPATSHASVAEELEDLPF